MSSSLRIEVGVTSERVRKKRAERRHFTTAARVRHHDDEVGAGELGQHLAARTARRHHALAVGSDRDGDDRRVAFEHGARDRISFGADRQSVARALDVRRDVDATGRAQQRSADSEVRVRSVRAFARGLCGLDESVEVHARHENLFGVRKRGKLA